jgi:hypothetical protein
MALARPPDLPKSLRQKVTAQTLSREYVSGGRLSWLGLNQKQERVLPWAIDDISASFGDDIYERMLKDPQIAACMQVYKSSIIEEGASLSSPIDDPDDPNVEVAKALNQAAVEMFDNLVTPLDQVLDNMLDAAAYGNKTAELVWDFQTVDGDTRLQLTAIKPKPRLVTAFIVDAYMNLLGLLYQDPAKPFSLIPGTSYIQASNFSPADILPLEKFVVLTFRPHDNDPRGSSILRPAYKPWTVKQQIYPEYIKYLAQFAGPSLIGYTAEDSDQLPTTDALANPDSDQTASLTPEEEMALALENFHNSTVAVFPNGAKVEPVQMQGDGRAFLNGFGHCDQQMVTAILTQTMATQESEHMARAAAQVHQDVLDTLIRQGKKIIVRMIQTILKRWIRYNWGELLIPLCPVVTLGSAEQRQIPSIMASVAQLQGTGYFAPEQMPGVDRMLGLPVRDVTKMLLPPPEPIPDPNVPPAGPTPAPEAP